MFRNYLLCSAFAVVAAAACLAVAQPYYANPYYGGYGGYRASTAGESYARGFADVIRSQGEKNLNDSVAAGNYEDARSKYLDNRLKSAENYWARREIYDRKQAEEAYERQVKREAYFSKTLLQPLDDKQFDAASGAIGWPILCREEEFSKYRETLDSTFSKLANSGVVSMDEYTQAAQAIKEFRAAITAKKADYPKEAVSSALRFLINLNRELENQLG